MFWVSVDPATGRVNASTGTPLTTDPYIAGIRYQAAKPCAMYCQSGVAPPTALIQYGVAHDLNGVAYVVLDMAPPVPAYYSDGVLVDKFGTIQGTVVNPVSTHVGGVPIDSAGRVCFGAGGFGPVAQFNAPLTNSLIPTTAGDPSFTFVRASPAYVTDQDGVLRNVVSGEARFQGARRVRNMIAFSENLTPGLTWQIPSFGTATVTANDITAPDGTLTADRVDYGLNSGNGSAVTANSTVVSQVADFKSYRGSVYVKGTAGQTINVWMQGYGGSAAPVMVHWTLTGAWDRVCPGVYSGFTLVNESPVLVIGTRNLNSIGLGTANSVWVWGAQVEEVSGAVNQAPSEYVSCGVLAAPYNGAGVDGVKYFGTTNGNSGGNTNLRIRSQEFDAIAWGKSNTTVTADVQTAPDGSLTADMITAGINAYAYVGAVQVGGAGPATSSAHFKAGTAPYGWIDDTTQNVRAVFNVTTGAFTGWEGTPTTHVFRSTVLPNGWIRASLSWVTAVTIQTQMGLSAAPASGVALAGQTIYMWGAQVEQSAVAGSYIPTTTAAVTNPVVTAGVGAAIPAASLLGYTAENIVTNLQIQSQQFDLWANTEATVTANVLMAPDGSLTADMLTDNAQNNVHRVFNSSNQTAAVYTSSVYVKKGTLPWVQLFAQIGVGFGANFNLTTGAIGIVTAGATAAVQVLPNGWFRFSITYTAVAAVGNFHILASLTDANIIGPTYVGTGQTMYLWGAQVELGDLSSYIPTTTATVFRSYDQLTYQKAGNYDGAIGSAYAECYLPTAQVGQQNVVLFTGAGYPLYFEPSVHALAIYSGPVVAGLNTRIVGATNKSASGWSGATCSVVLNGGAPGTGAYTAIPLSTGIVGVGHINAGVQIIQGSIRNLKLYPTRLTDAQLQALTA